jgi:hypothetical protein
VKVVHELVCLIEERLGTANVDHVRNKEKKVKSVDIHQIPQMDSL